MKLSQIKEKIDDLMMGLNAEQVWQTLSLIKDVLEDPSINAYLFEADMKEGLGEETLLEIELGYETQRKTEEILKAINKKNFQAVRDYINMHIEQYSQEVRLPKKIIENLGLVGYQLNKVEQCYEANKKSGRKFSSFLDELLAESSKILNSDQKLQLANLYFPKKRNRHTKNNVKEREIIDITTVSDSENDLDKDFTDKPAKKVKRSRHDKKSIKKPSNVDDALWQRICLQLVAAKKEFFKATTFESTNTPEIRRVEIREDKPVLQHVMKIKPDVLCGIDANKCMDFLQTIVDILKAPKVFNCRSAENIILIKEGMNLEEEWNKHYRTNKQGQRFFVGYILNGTDYKDCIGTLILKGATAVRVAEKIDQCLSTVELQANSKQEEIALKELPKPNSSYEMFINTLTINAGSSFLEKEQVSRSAETNAQEQHPQPVLEYEDDKFEDSNGMVLT